MGKVIAVTGAAGYLGSSLVSALSKQSWVERIIALDIKMLPDNDLVIPYYLDMRDPAFLRGILAEHAVTHLVHAAFVLNRPPWMTEAQMRASNVDGSKQVLLRAMEYGIEHLTFLSSVSVYGYRPSQLMRLNEEASQRPTTLYGQHKVEVERYLYEQQRHYPRTHVAVIRPSAVIGPRGRSRSDLRTLIAQPVFVTSNGGRALTQAIHEDDLTTLLTAVLEHDVTGTYNAAPDDSASWAEIAKLSKLPPLSLPRPLLDFATRFNKIFPALNGFTREVVEMFSESLVVDNRAARQGIPWSPHYSTRDAYAEMFGAPVREYSASRL